MHRCRKQSDFIWRVKRWNKEVFGDIGRRKDQLIRRLGGVQRRLAQTVTPGLLKLENKLKSS